MKTISDISVSIEGESNRDFSGKDLGDGEEPPAPDSTWIPAGLDVRNDTHGIRAI